MDTGELSQFRKLEDEILLRELLPAEPVGLRLDRLTREGWLPRAFSSAEQPSPGYSYWECNRLTVAALLGNSSSILAACEESWAKALPLTAVRPQGPFVAVLADSSILLSGELRETLFNFRRVLRKEGRVVVLAANWAYEMDGEPLRYELTFRRYHGNVYAGLVKRTLEPPYEVEYVCLLDPAARVVRETAKLSRDELRHKGIRDAAGLERLVVGVEVIRIPQATVNSLTIAGREAGFSQCVVSGAPGILAARLGGALPEKASGPAEEIRRALASSFPFVPASGSPHLLAVFTV